MNCYLCGTQDLIRLTAQLRNGPGVVLYCEGCDLGLLEDKPPDLRKYYDEEYRKSHGPRLNYSSSYMEIFESHVNYQASRMELLKPWLNPNVRLLEVGCSTGHFLYNVKDLVGEVVGVDYDFGAAEFASQVCGCTTFGCGLEETGLEPASFDVVCAIQTMEHVEDPIGFATMISKYLKPNGIIFIEVPNLNDPLLAVYHNLDYRNFYFHKAHLFYFSPKSLKRVMNEAGFSGQISFAQDYNLLNHLHWSLLGKPQTSCHDGLSIPTLSIAANTEELLRKELDFLMEELDRQYKAILAKYGVTDNMAFIGSKVER